MGLGRSPIRLRCPLPSGMLMPQLYRWARLLTNWLGTFTDSTWAYTPSTPAILSNYHFTPVISVDTSAGLSAHISIKIVNPLGSTIQRRSWLYVWFASAIDTLPANTADTVSMSVGTLLWRTGSPTPLWAMATGTSFSTQFRPPTFGHDVYVAAQIHNGPAVWSSVKMAFASVHTKPWYVYYSALAESGEWRAVYMEPRYSVGNTRVEEDRLITIYLAVGAWSPTSPGLASVLFSGPTVLREHLALRNYQVVLKSTGGNYIKMRKVGTGGVRVHTYADVAGRAWVSDQISYTA